MSLGRNKDGTVRFFRLGDPVPDEVCRKLDEMGYMRLAKNNWSNGLRHGDHILKDDLMVRAKTMGVKRPPKKGEWYLSGAHVRAYQAPNDLETVYNIAHLVLVQRKIIKSRIELETL